MTDFKKVDKHVNRWYMLGRVAPFGALFIICVLLAFDLNTYLEYALLAVAIFFAIFAFAWWWWVLDTVKQLFAMMEKTHRKFDDVLGELSKVKQDLNDSNWERTKSEKDKSK